MFIQKDFTFKSADGIEIAAYQWRREDVPVKGVVQISHGMAERAIRYKRFAEELTTNGLIVYAHDHRGHGQTAENIEQLGYLGEEDGFIRLVDDLAKMTAAIQTKHPNVPLFLFSHSMGSFAAQRYIIDYQVHIDGLILAGSNGEQGVILKLGKALAKMEMFVRGRKAQSKIMDQLIFGSYNKNFHPKTTGSEWLTRDKQELAKYLHDPYCGSIFPASFYYEFLDTLEYIEDAENFAKLPQDLPILIISGKEDPVGDFGKGVVKLYDRYENQGIKDVQLKLYEGARHELLNELNREEVTADIIQWVEEKLTKHFLVKTHESLHQTH